MELSNDQKRTFIEQGYLKLPGIVPRPLVDAAMRAINASIGSNGIHPEQLPTFRSQSYCPELKNAPVILDLLTASPLWSIAESAIGAGQIRPVSNGQIALRFPVLDQTPREPQPHLDGMYTPTNGVPAGTIRNFTALIGIYLSNVPEPFAGNFSVWSGTHTLYEQYFRKVGPQALLDGMPKVELSQPEQMTGSAGDAFLCHYQLAHGIAGNVSPHIRYGIFFRLSHVDHDSVRWESMTDIWREWAGLRELTRSR